MSGTVLMAASSVVLFGFSMFVWGTLAATKDCLRREDAVYMSGWHDGWEACANLDEDVRTIWGGDR